MVLKSKADDLEYLNIALIKEISRKKEIQQKMVEAIIQPEKKAKANSG